MHFPVLSLFGRSILGKFAIQAGSYDILMVLLIQHILNIGLTYKEVLAAESGAKFSVSDLETLQGEELKKSVQYLGRYPLQQDQASAIWVALVKEYGNVSKIPEEIIQHIGWVSAGIPPEDFKDLSLRDTDTLLEMGKYHALNSSQLTALAESVRCQWWFKGPEDYTQFDLMFLKHILCAFNQSDLRRIHADSYKGPAYPTPSCASTDDKYDIHWLVNCAPASARTTLGYPCPRKAAEKLRNLKNCSADVIEAFAFLASQKSAFGQPHTWNAYKVSSIGCIIAGLSPRDMTSIPDEAMDGLTEDAISSIPPDALKAMTAGQLSMLRVHVIDTLSPEQMEALSSEQQYTLRKATEKVRKYANR